MPSGNAVLNGIPVTLAAAARRSVRRQRERTLPIQVGGPGSQRHRLRGDGGGGGWGIGGRRPHASCCSPRRTTRPASPTRLVDGVLAQTGCRTAGSSSTTAPRDGDVRSPRAARCGGLDWVTLLRREPGDRAGARPPRRRGGRAGAQLGAGASRLARLHPHRQARRRRRAARRASSPRSCRLRGRPVAGHDGRDDHRAPWRRWRRVRQPATTLRRSRRLYSLRLLRGVRRLPRAARLGHDRRGLRAHARLLDAPRGGRPGASPARARLGRRAAARVCAPRRVRVDRALPAAVRAAARAEGGRDVQPARRSPGSRSLGGYVARRAGGRAAGRGPDVPALHSRRAARARAGRGGGPGMTAAQRSSCAGCRVDLVDERAALARIEELHDDGPPRFVSYVNPHTVNLACRDPDVRSDARRRRPAPAGRLRDPHRGAPAASPGARDPQRQRLQRRRAAARRGSRLGASSCSAGARAWPERAARAASRRTSPACAWPAPSTATSPMAESGAVVGPDPRRAGVRGHGRARPAAPGAVARASPRGHGRPARPGRRRVPRLRGGQRAARAAVDEPRRPRVDVPARAGAAAAVGPIPARQPGLPVARVRSAEPRPSLSPSPCPERRGSGQPLLPAPGSGAGGCGALAAALAVRRSAARRSTRSPRCPLPARRRSRACRPALAELFVARFDADPRRSRACGSISCSRAARATRSCSPPSARRSRCGRGRRAGLLLAYQSLVRRPRRAHRHVWLVDPACAAPGDAGRACTVTAATGSAGPPRSTPSQHRALRARDGDAAGAVHARALRAMIGSRRGRSRGSGIRPGR